MLNTIFTYTLSPTSSLVLPREKRLPVLGEANVGALLTEALTADVQAVLADQTSLVGADTAAPGALAVGARARVPDGFVRHIGGGGWLRKVSRKLQQLS